MIGAYTSRIEVLYDQALFLQIVVTLLSVYIFLKAYGFIQ